MRERYLSAAAASLVAAACFGISCGPGRLDAAGEWGEARAALDRRVNAALDVGDYSRALALADSAIASGERDSRLLGQRARSLGGLERQAEAVAAFEEAILSDYENCENHLHFATYLMRIGKTGRAHTEFMEARTFCESGRYAVIFRNLAVANIKLERQAEARRYVEEGLAVAPADPYLLGLKGMLVAREQPAAAESLFAAAFAGGEASSELLVQYGLLLMNAGRADEAVRVFERADSVDSGRREVRVYLAEALDRAGRPLEAVPVLRGLLAAGDDPALAATLARALFHAGSYSEALEAYRALPESPETMDRIAMCLHNLGRTDEALSWARRAAAGRPEWAQGMINLAVILAARGELAEARALLERALALEPENVAARINLERLREAERRGADEK